MTNNAATAKEIAALASADLKEAGFRKQGGRFNRTMPGGVTHVVQFEMQPSWGHSAGAGLFEFAVFTPRMEWHGQPVPAFISAYMGQVRINTAQLRPSYVWPEDFDLSDKSTPERLVEPIPDGLTWLASYPDEMSLLDAYEQHGVTAFNGGSGSIRGVVELYRALGDDERAKEIAATIATVAQQPQRLASARNFLIENGWDDLVALMPPPLTPEEQQLDYVERISGLRPRPFAQPAPRITSTEKDDLGLTPSRAQNRGVQCRGHRVWIVAEEVRVDIEGYCR